MVFVKGKMMVHFRGVLGRGSEADSNKTAVVSGATLLSRILGFVRDALIAMLLGAGFYSDAFFIAFRLPNVLRKFFSDGVLSISFIPSFTGCLIKGGPEDAFSMARSACFMLSVLSTAAAVAGILFAPFLVRIIAPGFFQESHKFAVTVLLTRMMMPYVICISLSALCMGILNCLGHFAAPAAAPVVFNMVIICFAAVVAPHMALPAAGLALGIVAGGIIQLLLQFPFLSQRGFFLFRRTALIHPGAVRAGKTILPVIIGAAAYQINVVVSTFMASTLQEGSISYLYYADRLVQFPLALFAVSVSIVLLPGLSRKIAEGSLPAASELFSQGVRLVFFITLPAMAGLIALREPVVSLLFQQGVFDEAAVRETASALLFFGVGLWAFSGTRLFVTLFYALSDVRTPLIAGLVSVAVNGILTLVLMKLMGHKGVALAISLASILNFMILFLKSLSHLKAELLKEITISACRSVFISAILYLLVRSMAVPVLSGAAGDKLSLLIGVFTSVIAGVVFYFVASWLAGAAEISVIKEKVLGR